MPDTPVGTGATPANAKSATKPQKSPLNQTQTKELQKAALICRAAKRPAYATKLAERNVTAAIVNATLAKIKTCSSTSKSAAKNTRLRKTATKTEAAAKKSMLSGVQTIQSEAIRKHRNDPEALGDYAINQNLSEVGRATLEATIPTLLETAGGDDLPGIDDVFIAKVQADFDAWIAADESQSTAQTDATTQRGDRDTMIKEIKATRIDIQLAADALWPYSDPKNAAVRRVFQLPDDRPFRP